MARITRVAKAQQRYETVPVIDPETGEPKRTPVINKRTGEQKTTKRGTPVFMSVTQLDKTKPKANLRCDFPGCDIDGGEILPGSAYMHVSPKSGPYGGVQRNRHQVHPAWQQWDLSNSLSAQLARIAHDFSEAIDTAESPDDVTTALGEAAASVEEIADQKQESADNIEEGFGHATSSSEELTETADQLRDWAGEFESADVPEMTECEECSGDGKVECETCEGSGEVEDEVGDKPCDDCEGAGDNECSNCDGTGEDLEAWREEVRDNVTIVDESPV